MIGCGHLCEERMTEKRKRSRRVNADLKAIEAVAAEVRARKAAVTVVPAKPDSKPKPSPSPLDVPVVPFSDPGPPPINTLFGIGRPQKPPALHKDGRRRAGDYVMAAVRIKAETASRPGDFLNGSDNRLAESWLEAAVRPIEAKVPMVLGGELLPITEGTEADNALVCLKNTIESPTYITADASRDRIQLALDAGALELGLDLADTVQAENSLEKLLSHQLAATHRATMKMMAQLNRCVEDMEHYDPDAKERANVQGTRLAGSIARMQGAFQSGMLALHKMRSGGTQRVIVQHVHVEGGAQAVVAGEMNAGQAGGRVPRKGRG
jgi:hypothetical protein